MNDVIERRIKLMREVTEKIKTEADGILDDLEQFKEYPNDDELASLEMDFDRVREYGKEGYEICRNTYDELEEEEYGDTET